MKWRLVNLFAVLLFLIGSGAALAHGVVISYNANEKGQIELQGVFDTGEHMAEAQVTIYSPEDPAKPWLTGVADEEGRFVFTPDRAGTWDVQFRKAGHGDIVHIAIEEMIEVDSSEAVAQPSQQSAAAGTQRLAVVGASTGLTTSQILLMSGSIIWGFIGTALFFARGRSK